MRSDAMELENVGPGLSFEDPLILALIDMDDQVVNLDNSSTIIILPKNSSESAISGTNVVLVQDGIAIFDSLSLVVNKRKRNANFTISSGSINLEKVMDALQTSIIQNDLTANFRDCKPGERILGNACVE